MNRTPNTVDRMLTKDIKRASDVIVRRGGRALRPARRLLSRIQRRGTRTQRASDARVVGGEPGLQAGHFEGHSGNGRSLQRMRNVEQAIGMTFASQELLRDALTHRSYLNETREPRPSNERLEFLGDAVLGMITTDYLYEKFPEMSEGELTNLRSALVRTEALARFSRDLDLGSNLFLGRGEEMSRGRQRPAGLACAFEALLGAVYLDQGYDAARDFALRFIEPALDNVLDQRLHRNSKSMLQELVQAHRQKTPAYHVIEEAGPDHNKRFTVEVRVGDEVLGTGVAANKRAAEQNAAEDALARWRNDSVGSPRLTG